MDGCAFAENPFIILLIWTHAKIIQTAKIPYWDTDLMMNLTTSR
jgi:hypothetical protein